MANKTIIASAFGAVVGGIVGASLVIVGFWLFRPNSRGGIPGPEKPTSSPKESPEAERPTSPIVEADFESVILETEYTGFFDSNSRCAKNYNETFGRDDGYFSDGSPCAVKLVFSREGNALRSEEFSRYDKTRRQLVVQEKSSLTANISSDQFKVLATAIADNEAFKTWREGTMINQSNCKITVVHAHGTKQIMSYLGPSTTLFNPMVDAVKNLDHSLKWQKA